MEFIMVWRKILIKLQAIIQSCPKPDSKIFFHTRRLYVLILDDYKHV
jgi:hypothetical protein